MECLFLQADLLAEIDAGRSIRKYDDKYWARELKSSRNRSYGSSLARVAEVLHYARAPVENFIDIGTGAGYLLDFLAYHLPSRTSTFYGVEMYPPDQVQSAHPNYLKGRIGDLGKKFQAGSCIEVVEHLTPAMLRTVAQELAAVSDPQAAYIFNTGLADFVKSKKPDYLPFLQARPHHRLLRQSREADIRATRFQDIPIGARTGPSTPNTSPRPRRAKTSHSESGPRYRKIWPYSPIRSPAPSCRSSAGNLSATICVERSCRADRSPQSFILISATAAAFTEKYGCQAPSWNTKVSVKNSFNGLPSMPCLSWTL